MINVIGFFVTVFFIASNSQREGEGETETERERERLNFCIALIIVR
jgi:hypothetical protein